jgi:hypothetical protein
VSPVQSNLETRTGVYYRMNDRQQAEQGCGSTRKGLDHFLLLLGYGINRCGYRELAVLLGMRSLRMPIVSGVGRTLKIEQCRDLESAFTYTYINCEAERCRHAPS